MRMLSSSFPVNDQLARGASMQRTGRRGKIAVVHTVRLLVLLAILLLIHRQHQKFESEQRAQGLDSVPLQTLRRFFPQADRLGPVESHGGRLVLNADEQAVGFVIQTSPASDRFLGFSGSTNLLICVDNDEKIKGVSILSSGDTRDHVKLTEDDPHFFRSFEGVALDVPPNLPIDTVSGATLTSTSILQGLQARLNNTATSSHFPEPLTAEDVRPLFPEADSIMRDERSSALWHVSNEQGQPLGTVLRLSPTADRTIGYQGPTDALIGVSTEQEVIGLVLLKSFDNDPYVRYVREDSSFRSLFSGKSIDDLAAMDWESAGIEGVSGATMTSQAVAQGALTAARQLVQERRQQEHQLELTQDRRWRLSTTAMIVALGILIAFTRLKGQSFLRKGFQILVIAYLGFVNADLLSLAMFSGWAQSGIPWSTAPSLVLLSAAAILLPVMTRRNVYCDHICPHGAVQQLLPRRFRWQNPPRWLLRSLGIIRPALMLLAVLATMSALQFSLVDVEPFDAYSWRAAAWSAITIAIVSLVASLFLPMGYCRLGCPTGALLGYLRRHPRSDRLTPADIFALVLLTLAVALS